MLVTKAEICPRDRGNSICAAAAPPLEELGAEMALQHADAVGDGGRGRGDAELLGGADEAPVPGGGLEEAQAVEGRQGYHGFGRGKWWGWRQINRYFLLHKYTFLKRSSEEVTPECRFALVGMDRRGLQAEDGQVY